DHLVAQDDLDFHLGKEINDIFGTAIEFSVAFLAAESLGFRDRDALKPHLLKSLLNLVELERLYNGLDFFHCGSSFARATRAILGARRWLAGSMPISAKAGKDLWCQPPDVPLPRAFPI